MIEILTINKRSIKLHTQLFINGEWTDPKQGKKFDIEDPSTGKNLVSFHNKQHCFVSNRDL